MIKPIVFGVCSAALIASLPAWSQKHVQSTFESRLVLAYKINAAELQRWIPSPWQSQPADSGPAKDANLIVNFVDRHLDLGADGKPVKLPSYRVMALAVPARNPQTGEAGPLVVRIYNSSPDAVPGFYKTAVLASVERELSSRGSGTTVGMANDRWLVKDAKGGTLELQVEYERGIPTRALAESKPRSGSDPTTWRIYKIDQANDVVKSLTSGIDRIKSFRLRNNIDELAKIFDGSEQLVAVTSVPSYTRQTLLPDL